MGIGEMCMDGGRNLAMLVEVLLVDNLAINIFIVILEKR